MTNIASLAGMAALIGELARRRCKVGRTVSITCWGIGAEPALQRRFYLTVGSAPPG